MVLKKAQQGVATIVVTVVLLVVMTLMVIFAARVGVFDVRMSANETRYKEAFEIAEAGLDYSTQRFASEFSRLYDGTSSGTASTTLTTILANAQVTTATEPDGTSPEAGEPSFTVSAVASGATTAAGVPVYTFTSIGVGADGTGTATVQRQISMANVFGGSVPEVPVIVGGSVGTGGNFNVVANPDGGGEGVPVSIWSNDSVTASSSSATCHYEFYEGNNAQCSNPSGNDENITRGTNPATAIASYDATYPDVLPNDANFPADLFEFMFGLDHDTEWQLKRAEAQANQQYVTDCTSVVAAGTAAGQAYPLWWVEGDCAISANSVIGSTSNPVILVIHDGELSTNGNAQINGIVYLFDETGSGSSPSASLNGTTEIIGSLISDVGGSAMSGSYSIVYDPSLVTSFMTNGSNFSFAYIPGSWRDFP